MDNKFMLIYFLITAQIKSGLSRQKIIQKEAVKNLVSLESESF